MARLCADENFPHPAVEGLRKLGHDVHAIQKSGLANRAMPDAEILELAAAQGRALITLNRRHFIRLHRERPQHEGIIVCKVETDFDRLAQRVHRALAGKPALAGLLIRINRRS